MFDFFEEIVDFLNERIQMMQNDDYANAFGLQFYQTIRQILLFIRALNLAPLGYGFILPTTFIALFFEWRARHKKSGGEL